MKVHIDLLKSAWGHIKKYLRKMAQSRHIPSGLPDGCEGIVTNGAYLRIGMPLDPPLMKEVADAFRSAGWSVGDYKHDDYGLWMEANAKLYINDHKFILCHLTAFDYKDGATCKIERVGEETVTKQVYETVCNDGSKEKVFA